MSKYFCDRQLGMNRRKRKDGAGIEGYQSGKPWVFSKGKNWENKDLTTLGRDLSFSSMSLVILR